MNGAEWRPKARIRIERDVAELLLTLLWEERSRLISAKIEARTRGEDTSDYRHRLILLKRLYQEAQRAIEEVPV